MFSQICHVFMKEVALDVAESNAVWVLSWGREQCGTCPFQASPLRSSWTPIHLEKQVSFVFKQEYCHMPYPTSLWTWWRFSVRALWSLESSSFPTFTADNTVLYFCLDGTLLLINSTVLFRVPPLPISTYLLLFGYSGPFCCFPGPPVLRIKQSYLFLKVDLFRVERGPKWVLIQFPSQSWTVNIDRRCI